jgi:hypothetical protein
LCPSREAFICNRELGWQKVARSLASLLSERARPNLKSLPAIAAGPPGTNQECQGRWDDSRIPMASSQSGACEVSPIVLAVHRYPPDVATDYFNTFLCGSIGGGRFAFAASLLQNNRLFHRCIKQPDCSTSSITVAGIERISVRRCRRAHMPLRSSHYRDSGRGWKVWPDALDKLPKSTEARKSSY